MIDITFEQFCGLDFKLYDNNPVIRNFGGSFTAADPTILTPDVTPDGKWYLFCHTFFGVYRLISEDGINYGKPKHILRRAMRPNINYINGRYYLFYERTRTLLGNALTLLNAKWKSNIYFVQSVDLDAFTKPRPVITCTRPYEVSDRGQSISNPFLLRIDDKYRLYFSAGLTYIEDCGFSEPTYISYAESRHIHDDYEALMQPIISPDKDHPYLNLCSGCLKVYRLKDRYIGLQNGIYKEDGKSKSAIMLLSSDDGKEFAFVKPLILPDESKEWMAQYVYACCLTSYNDELRIYFNARNLSDPMKGRESIGFAYAQIPR